VDEETETVDKNYLIQTHIPELECKYIKTAFPRGCPDVQGYVFNLDYELL
jgi:hypothetical protein